MGGGGRLGAPTCDPSLVPVEVVRVRRLGTSGAAPIPSANRPTAGPGGCGGAGRRSRGGGVGSLLSWFGIAADDGGGEG